MSSHHNDIAKKLYPKFEVLIPGYRFLAVTSWGIDRSDSACLQSVRVCKKLAKENKMMPEKDENNVPLRLNHSPWYFDPGLPALAHVDFMINDTQSIFYKGYPLRYPCFEELCSWVVMLRH